MLFHFNKSAFIRISTYSIYYRNITVELGTSRVINAFAAWPASGSRTKSRDAVNHLCSSSLTLRNLVVRQRGALSGLCFAQHEGVLLREAIRKRVFNSLTPDNTERLVSRHSETVSLHEHVLFQLFVPFVFTCSSRINYLVFASWNSWLRIRRILLRLSMRSRLSSRADAAKQGHLR